MPMAFAVCNQSVHAVAAMTTTLPPWRNPELAWTPAPPSGKVPWPSEVPCKRTTPHDEEPVGKWYKKARKLAKMVVNDKWIEAKIYATMCSSAKLDEDYDVDIDKVIEKVSA